MHAQATGSRCAVCRKAGAVIGLTVLLAACGASAADAVLSFDAKPERVATTGRISSNDFTAEAWFKLSGYLSENQIFSQYDGSSGRFIVGIKNTVAGMFIGGTWMTGSGTIPLNTWTHIAVSRSNTTWTIYINGQLYKSGVNNANPLANATFAIGAINTTADGFRGEISEVRAWNTVRTPAQIAGALGVRLNGTEAGLAHYWPLNEGSGGTVADLVAGANGTLDAGVAWTVSADLPILAALPDTGSWSAAGGGAWSDGANWLDAAVPDGLNVIAYFTNQPPTALTVTNDVAALTLGQIVLAGAAAHTFTGQAVTLTNVFMSAVTASQGAHHFDLPLVTTAPGVIIATETPAELTFSGVLSGTGPVSLNPLASGGGRVVLNAANTFTGPLATGSGTLTVDTLNNGGTAGPLGLSGAGPDNLLLGPGTLHYTGGNTATDRGYTVQAGASPVRAAVFHADADVTFGGQILADSGAFIKTGAGTLSFTYPGWNRYIAHEGMPNAFLNIGDNGDSPTLGFSGFVIAQGRVVLGVPGQVNIFSNRVDIGVFTTTNAGAEHAAELVVNDGTFICSTTLSIGRNNGNTNTAPDGTASAFTVNGGEAWVNLLAAGHNAVGHVGFNPRSVCQLNGGLLDVLSTCNMGEHAGSCITLNVTGGTLAVHGASHSIRIGAGTGEGIFNLTGGTVEATDTVQLARDPGELSKGTLNLDGGTLIAANIVRGAGTNAYAHFNGGRFKPRVAGRTLAGLTRATLRAGGFHVDTALADFTVAQALIHDDALGGAPDGGLVKHGAGTLTFADAASTYTGPTLVSGGVLRVTGTLPPASAVTVTADGELLAGGSAVQTLSAVALALEPGGTLGFGFAADGTANDRLAVAGTPLLGTGRCAFYLAGTRLPFTLNGTYTLLSYSGAALDVSGLACANPVFGKSYAFAAADGNVTVTISSGSAGASVWNVDAGGDWATGSNWTVPQPGTSGSAARFDDAISAPVTVAAAGQSAGALYVNSPFAYTLGGTGLTLDNGASAALIAVESGSHAVTAPLTLASDLTVTLNPDTGLSLGAVNGTAATLTATGSGALALHAAPAVQAVELDLPAVSMAAPMTISAPVTLPRTVSVAPDTGVTVTLDGAVSGGGGVDKDGSSILVLAAANTYAGPTEVHAGTLRVAALAAGGAASPVGASPAAPANLVLGKGTLHITGPSITDRGYTVRTGSSTHAAVLRVDDEAVFGGPIRSESGGFLKTGPGTVSYTYPGLNTLHTHDVNSPAGVQNIGPYGDAPTTGVTGFTITQGRVVLGAPAQTNMVNRIDIGLRTTTEAGLETPGELVVTDGVLRSANTVSIGRNNGTLVTAGPTGVSSRLTVTGGTCDFPTLAMGNNGAGLSGYNARPVVDVSGGLVQVGGSYLSVGESPGAQATLLISGGTVTIWRAGSTLRIGGWATGGAGGNGTVRLWGGGVLEINGNLEVGYGQTSEAEFHLDGGCVGARAVIGLSGTHKAFWFNGGVFQPNTPNQTMSGLTAAYVSTNGAWVDTARADGFDITQNLLHDPVLGTTPDGGLVKAGAHTLSLTGMANSFNGPVEVRAGLLRARLGATNDLAVAAGAAFDALGERCTVGDLIGDGVLTNGTVAVTGTLDPGTNGAPAGATITVQNLALTAGATLACPWTTNALGQVTCDSVTVSGTLTAEGPGFFDLGRTEQAPIPVPFTFTAATYGASAGSFNGWKAVGTGLPPEKKVATVVEAADGIVTVTILYSGTLLLLQ